MSKRAIRALLASSALLRAWRALPGTQLSIFTLHRFAVPELGIEGHDPHELADTLAHLRRERIAVLPLGGVVEALRDRAPLPRRAVVFTVDDGYFDFAEVGAPVFARYDCPVTVFLVTGFLDGACWLWWDKLRYIFTHGSASLSAALLGNGGKTPTPAQVTALAGHISQRCTRIPNPELLALVAFLAERAQVELPHSPPEAFRPMSWDSAKQLIPHGVTFGPHTVTHPMLDRTTEDHAAREIAESWRRIREVIEHPIPVFSYPNGGYGAREVGLVRSSGLRASVATTPRYLTIARPRTDDDWFYRLPRFPYPDQTHTLLLTAAGFRRLPHPPVPQILRGSSPR